MNYYIVDGRKTDHAPEALSQETSWIVEAQERKLLTALRSLANKYSKTTNGLWLGDVDFKSLDVKFTTLMPDESKYQVCRIDKIFVQFEKANMAVLKSGTAEATFPAYIVALYRQWYKSRHMIRSFICRLFNLREPCFKDFDDIAAKARAWLMDRDTRWLSTLSAKKKPETASITVSSTQQEDTGK